MIASLRTLFAAVGALTSPSAIAALAITVTAAGFWIAYQFVEPAPPRHIVISTGPPDGAYHLYAERYRTLLARHGITLELRPSGGSVDNLVRLTEPQSMVDLAFVQGGTGDVLKSSGRLLSLGSLYYEPLWVFHRRGLKPDRLTDLHGQRLAVGEPGSGTRMVALKLLRDNRIDEAATIFEPLGGRRAAMALRQGELDAAFFIAGVRSPLIQELLRDLDIRPMSFERAAAYTRIYPYLSRVTLPEGVIDLPRNIPERDTTLIAATANLVVTEDFHPALVDLLLQAAREIHGGKGMFESVGEFPSPRHLVFPLSPEADRFYRRGPSLLRRYLPFWLGTFIDRTLVMLIPVVVVLLPLLKILPPTLRWALRAKIYRYYGDVKAVERRVRPLFDLFFGYVKGKREVKATGGRRSRSHVGKAGSSERP